MKSFFISSPFKVVLIVITLSGAASCTDTNKPEDTKDVAEEHNEAKFDNANKENDSQFLADAAEISLEEIQLGQLAQQKSSMSDVKELGIMMEKEHNKSLKELTALAAKKIITIPSSPTNDAINAYNKLNKKGGNDFDLEYCEMMVEGHKNAIALFEKASKESLDSDIREWASGTLPNLRVHLDHAITCQKKCEKMN